MYFPKISNYLAFCLIALVIFAACSSNEDNPVTTPLTSNPPIFSIQSVTAPSKMLTSSNKMAKEAVTLLNNCGNFEACGCCFSPDENAQDLTIVSDNPYHWKYTWAEGTIAPTLIITTDANQDKWDLYLSGYDNQTTFNNWKKMAAVQSKDYKTGHVSIYKPNTATLIIDWIWNTKENGEFQLTKTCHEAGEYKLIVTVTATESVDLTKYELNANNQFAKSIKYTWDKDGKGQWWTYENNAESGSGSW